MAKDNTGTIIAVIIVGALLLYFAGVIKMDNGIFGTQSLVGVGSPCENESFLFTQCPDNGTWYRSESCVDSVYKTINYTSNPCIIPCQAKTTQVTNVTIEGGIKTITNTTIYSGPACTATSVVNPVVSCSEGFVKEDMTCTKGFFGFPMSYFTIAGFLIAAIVIIALLMRKK